MVTGAPEIDLGGESRAARVDSFRGVRAFRFGILGRFAHDTSAHSGWMQRKDGKTNGSRLFTFVDVRTEIASEPADTIVRQSLNFVP